MSLSLVLSSNQASILNWSEKDVKKDVDLPEVAGAEVVDDAYNTWRAVLRNLSPYLVYHPGGWNGMIWCLYGRCGCRGTSQAKIVSLKGVD